MKDSREKVRFSSKSIHISCLNIQNILLFLDYSTSYDGKDLQLAHSITTTNLLGITYTSTVYIVTATE